MSGIVVVVGNGMVGHKFLDLMIRRGATNAYRLVTFCEEPRLAYDRVNLSSYFSGKSADELKVKRLVDPWLSETFLGLSSRDTLKIVSDCQNRSVSFAANGILVRR